MEKNGIYEGCVEALSGTGEGIIKTAGATVFVPFCLTGEKVRFKALKVKDGIAYGKAEKIVTPSADRAEPRCPVFGKCGGCDIQHMKYGAQLLFKRRSVENTLKKIGGIYAKVEDTVACANEYGYRNKCAVPISVVNGRTVCGFYAPHSHRIVPVGDCAIQQSKVKDVFSALEEYFKSGVKGYDEVGGKGDIRHFVARNLGGKFIFALVAVRRVDTAPLVKELKKRFEEFTLLLNINRGGSNVIFGTEWHTVVGSGFFGAEEHGIRYRAGANTFVQVNDEMREKLYSAVLAEAEEGTTAVDLYSGGGLLTAMLANKCAEAYGVEIVEEASRCADGLKEANGLQGKMFNVCGKVEEEISRILEKTAGRKRIIVCDPPRKGMERSAVKAVATSGADKIILISCNPATLARDLGVLLGTLEERDGALVKTGVSSGGYEIKTVIPFDMFPQTKWCETLVVLSHKKPDGHINVKVEFGE